MKKTNSLILFCLLAMFLFNKETLAQNKGKKEKRKMVEITTEYGKIKLALYNETPLHRDNFLKLVEQKFYDSTIFHRIIKDFMIQGGDPDSKNAKPGQMLGNGDVGYTLPAELNPALYHKKGALAAARMGDDVNPQKNSSGCQFYIVQGRSVAETDLNNMEQRINMQLRQEIFGLVINDPANAALKNRFIINQQNNDSIRVLSAEVEPLIEAEFAKKPPFKYTQEQRDTYYKIGGTPHLDMGYTVFGEVIEGLDVIDKIATVERNQFDRPNKDVVMTIKVVKK
jgi:cyclophilin family peptidyl-prolyl cis-trans isomerase